MIKIKSHRIFAIVAFLMLAKDAFSQINFGSQLSQLKLRGAGKLILETPLTVSGTLQVDTKVNNSIQGATPSDLLTFSNGVYQVGSFGRAYLTGTIDPALADTIILDSGQTLEIRGDTILEAITIKGSGNNVSGQAVFTNPITLENSSAVLNLGLQSKLNQNIVLNGGQVTLTDDLSLQDGVFFSGTGTVNVNNKTLALPSSISSSWNDAITFLNANDIALTGYTTLGASANFTFSGASGTSRINGNGNILDISAGAVITVGTNHTLYISDVMIKGLGASGGDININATGGVVKFSNVTLDLDGSFAHDSGSMIFESSNCLVIARNSDKFNITGATTVLTIDGVALEYDPLGTASTVPNPFVASSGGTISYLNDGIIRANYFDTSSGNISFTLPIGSGDEYLPSNHVLGPNAQLLFLNATPLVAKTISLDGQGLFVQFNYSNTAYWSIDENVTVLLKNINLKDFDPSLITYLGAGLTEAKIIFGDNVTVSLNKDLTLSSRAMVFQGNSTIVGNGTTMTLGATNMLTIGSASKQLTIKNLNLLFNNATGLKALTDTNKVILQNSNILMTNLGFNFQQGYMDIKNTVNISGGDATTVGGSTTFTLSSPKVLNILSGSALKIARGVEFSYLPNIIADAGNALLEKRHFTLTDPSSSLWFDSSLMTTGTMGLALDYGKVFIDGKTVFNINATAGAEVELGSALEVEIAPGGILDIDGSLKYVSTTYP